MSTTLFISDLHLAEERPEINSLFFRFMEDTARGAEALYVLGDLFDYWVGDDQLDHDPLARSVTDTIRRLSDAGARVYFMHGNRDFLISERFAREAGLTILADPTLIELYNQQVLLMHGDTLCTEDVAYQQFRAQTRTAEWKNATLAKPYESRQQLAQSIRAQSDSEKNQKPEEIMDVTEATVEEVFRQHHYPLMIHGHTHRPATHRLSVDGHACERWVLADWHGRGECLEISKSGLRRKSFAVHGG
jgi:UDP-2,3-diacylglucosamine hydrolase